MVSGVLIMSFEELDPAKQIRSDRVVIGPPRLTIYELAFILAVRAAQLAAGAPPLIPVSEDMREEDIAREELKRKVLPIVVIRRRPDGYWQAIPLHKLEVMWDI